MCVCFVRCGLRVVWVQKLCCESTSESTLSFATGHRGPNKRVHPDGRTQAKDVGPEPHRPVNVSPHQVPGECRTIGCRVGPLSAPSGVGERHDKLQGSSEGSLHWRRARTQPPRAYMPSFSCPCCSRSLNPLPAVAPPATGPSQPPHPHFQWSRWRSPPYDQAAPRPWRVHSKS